MDVVVTGIGLISALGNLETTWKRLLAGESGILQHQPFPELSAKPLALVKNIPSEPTELLEQAIADALKTAHLTPPLPNCGVVIGSSRGYQGQLEKLSQEFYQFKNSFFQNKKPEFDLSVFSNYLHFNLALSIAHKIGSTSNILSPMAACSTGIWAIAQAYELIQTGQCQQVIAGVVEAPITPLILVGFEKMGAFASTGCYPFDRHRDGLVLGEGAAVFVLETADFAKERSAKIYGQILGFGLTTDACYTNRPDPEGNSAKIAIQDCLKRSQLLPEEINFIQAHGTGTILNDCHEVQLIQQLFDGAVPVSSTKGATGHTLGASGGLGIALSLMAIQQQVLPPCVGLKEPEFELNFVRVAQQYSVQNVLCLSFGFGGQNGAIALGNF